MKKSNPKVEIIVVKYNQPGFEANTIATLIDHTNYDNYTLTAYQNESGVGLSKCWNNRVYHSDAEYICLLNNDTYPCAHWLSKLMATFKSSNVCAVVPSSNKVFLSQVPDPPTEDDMEIFADSIRDDKRIFSLPTLSAMCVVFPKKLWEEVGGFDEDFFLYGGDSEFFYRLKKKTGKLLAWCYGAYVHHYDSQSVSKAVADGELNIKEDRDRANRLCKEKMPEFAIKHIEG